MAIMSFIEEVKELNTLLEIYMSDNNKQARAASDSSSKRGRLDRIINCQEFWNREMGYLTYGMGIELRRF